MSTNPLSFSDRREFGRRAVFLHGWICVEGRPRLPCLIRDISVAGARLDLNDPVSWLPYRFRLVVDVSRFAADCEIKHHRGRTLGVSFVTRETILEARPYWSPDDAQSWKGSR